MSPERPPHSPPLPESEPEEAPATREQTEPLDLLAPYFREPALDEEGAEPPPLWLWVAIFGVILFSVFYLGAFVGDYSDRVDFTAGPWLRPEVSDAEAPAVVRVSGEQIYASRCQTCHQASGEGLAGVFPPLNRSPWVTDDAGVFTRILLHGMQGPVEVRGNVYNGVMPAFPNLSDAELAAVITHVRQAWENSASEVTAEEVAAVREATAGRTQSWRAEELLAPENRGIPSVAASEPAEDGAGDGAE